MSSSVHVHSGAAGLINISPIVCCFFACAIKYATSYDALWASAGIVCLFSKDFLLALQLPLVPLIRVIITSWVNKEKEKIRAVNRLKKIN